MIKISFPINFPENIGRSGKLGFLGVTSLLILLLALAFFQWADQENTANNASQDTQVIVNTTVNVGEVDSSEPIPRSEDSSSLPPQVNAVREGQAHGSKGPILIGYSTEEIRKMNSVRRMLELEQGGHVSDLNGKYGFVSSLHLSYITKPELHGVIRVARDPLQYVGRVIEIHTTRDGNTTIIVFVNSTDAGSIRKFSR